MKEIKPFIITAIIGVSIIGSIIYYDVKTPKTVECISVRVVENDREPGLYQSKYYTTVLYEGVYYTINDRRLYKATVDKDYFKGNFRIRDYGDRGITLEYLSN